MDDAEVAFARIRAGRPAKSFLLVGLRGVGKTVLLNRMESMAERAEYRTLSIEVPGDKRLPELLVPPLRRLLFSLDRRQAMSEKVQRGFRVLRAFAGAIKVRVGQLDIELDIEPETGSADSGDLEADLPVLLVSIAEAAHSRQVAVAVLIDEMQYLTETELSALILAVHKISQKQLPFLMIGAGLPQLVALAGKSKSYAERLFDFPRVGALEPRDARSALDQPVRGEGASFEEPALTEIIETTEGYPYFLQEWGYHAWNTASGPAITLADVRAARTPTIRRLDESFFRVRFDRLTPREKAYLRAMADLGPGPHRSGDIADALGTDVRSVAPLRNGLIRKGMIFSPSHGDTAFTVPLFDQFLKRVMRPI